MVLPQKTVYTEAGSQNHILLLAGDTEHVLEEIFLSGFSGLRQSTMDRLLELSSGYETYGMKEGADRLRELILQLRQKKESLRPDLPQTMAAFARMEFYLEHLKSRAEQD